MAKIKIGVIGTGSISHAHLASYVKNNGAELVAVCDLNEQRAKDAAGQYGAAKAYKTYQELLSDSQIDAVSICTWNNTHAEIAIAALRAGKHVLVEKPLCKTVEEALKIEAAVKASGKLLQVGFVRRYASNTSIIKEMIDRGDLGEIYYAKASYLRRLGNPGGWFADVERSGGGPLIDIGVHVIDLCWYLMGRPKVKSVSGNTYNKLGNRANVQQFSFYKAADYDASKNTVEDFANALIRFENGASLTVDVSFTLHARKDEGAVKLFGTKGGAEIEPEFVIATEHNNIMFNMIPQIDHAMIDIGQAFQAEIDHFVDCCQTGATPISPVQDGVELMKILCGVYESSAKGAEVVF